MVDSRRGITNLNVPSDVIVDASIPPMIRDSGRMWNAKGELQDTKAIIPDSSYAGIYDAIIRDVQQHGQFDRTTMGSEGGRWIDSSVKEGAADVIEIEQFSDAFFDLCRSQSAELNQYLTFEEECTVELDSRVYRIVPAAKP